MPKLGEVYIDLKARNAAKTKAALGGVEKKATMASKATKMLKGALIGIGAYAVIHALKSVMNEFVEYTVNIDKFTKQTGIATGAIQKLVYAAEQEHGSLESLNKGLMNLTVRLGYAGDGLETYLRYFRALGIEYKKSDGTLRNTHDVFLDIADVVSKGTLSTEELAAVMQMFGARSAKELIPLLKKGRDWFELMGDEAERLGIVLDEKTIKAGKAFSDQMTSAGAAARGLKYNLAEVLMPTLNFVIKALTKAAAGWRAFLGGDDAKEIEARNKLVASALKRYKEWLDKGIISQEQYGIAIKKLMKLNQAWKVGMEGTIPVIDDTGDAVDGVTESFKEAIEQYREMIAEEEAHFERTWAISEALHGQGKAIEELYTVTLDWMELRYGKGEQDKKDIESINMENEALNALSGAFNSVSVGMMFNKDAVAEWASATAASLAIVSIKLLAMAAIVKLLESMGVPAGALLSAGQRFGLFQTPTGDWWAYKEGGDMARFFFQGFKATGNRMMGVASGIRESQQQTILKIYAEPGIIVEKMANMPLTLKSKFERDVSKKARGLES